MAVYKMQKSDRNARRVEVSPDHVEVHVPALIICVLAAFLIWLYFVNFTEDTTLAGAESGAVTECAGAETTTAADSAATEE